MLNKKIFLFILFFCLIYQYITLVNATTKNFEDENFYLMIILYIVISLFIVFILYLNTTKILYFGKLFRAAQKEKKILILILTNSGYKIVCGKISSEKIHDIIRYYVTYNEDNKTIQIPLLEEHIIRPHTNIKKFFPNLLILSEKYSTSDELIKKLELLDDIDSIKKNSDIFKKTLKKYYENNRDLQNIERDLSYIKEKINECKDECENINIIFRRKKIKGIITIVSSIIESLEEINNKYKELIDSLIEESKYRNKLQNIKNIILKIYDDTPVRIDFRKFELVILKFASMIGLMSSVIEKSNESNKKIRIFVLIIIILLIVVAFFIMNNFKLI